MVGPPTSLGVPLVCRRLTRWTPNLVGSWRGRPLKETDVANIYNKTGVWAIRQSMLTFNLFQKYLWNRAASEIARLGSFIGRGGDFFFNHSYFAFMSISGSIFFYTTQTLLKGYIMVWNKFDSKQQTDQLFCMVKLLKWSCSWLLVSLGVKTESVLQRSANTCTSVQVKFHPDPSRLKRYYPVPLKVIQFKN